MKKTIYVVTRAIYINNGLGLDILSDEDVLFDSESLEDAKKFYESKSIDLEENLTYDEANEKYFHKEIEAISLYSYVHDDEDDSKDDYDYLESVYSIC